MPRPCKRRRVCAMPGSASFGPLHGEKSDRRPISMTVDEFEAIRLIDLEGLTQEECAAHMDVARTTAQAIYNSARIKLAECLVQGRELTIGGGEYELCQGGVPGCRRRCRYRAQTEDPAQEIKGGIPMKIAVTYADGQVFQHFGHTEQFKIYDVADGEVTASAVVDTNGSGHGALAGFLRTQGVDTLICGGIGGGARQALANAGITLYGGVSGDADVAVQALLAGRLDYDPSAMCHHHDEHHGHDCGEHHNHSCGHHCGGHD